LAYVGNIPENLYKSFSEVFGELGHENTAELMRSLSSLSGQSEFMKSIIIMVVAKHFNVSKANIINDRTQGSRTDALMVCCFMYKKHLSLSHQQIAGILKRKTRSLVTKYIKFINCLDMKISYHRNISDKIAIVEQEITNHINNYKKHKA
jgi:chromosomal replication initiation ATPase DnaA